MSINTLHLQILLCKFFSFISLPKQLEEPLHALKIVVLIPFTIFRYCRVFEFVFQSVFDLGAASSSFHLSSNQKSTNSSCQQNGFKESPFKVSFQNKEPQSNIGRARARNPFMLPLFHKTKQKNIPGSTHCSNVVTPWLIDIQKARFWKWTAFYAALNLSPLYSLRRVDCIIHVKVWKFILERTGSKPTCLKTSTHCKEVKYIGESEASLIDLRFLLQYVHIRQCCVRGTVHPSKPFSNFLQKQRSIIVSM